MNNKKYISVEDAIKTTWMILDGLGYAFDENPQLKETVPAVFDTAPTSDVRPVVTCADCEHNNACLTQAFVEDESKVPFDRNTFFCADGKRADDA